jgi:pilus assembly protein FimV
MQKRPVRKRVASVRLSMMGTIFLFSNWALGLGLGNIEVQSALSQPLRAEIELGNVDDWAASDLKVALAETNDFKRLGVELTPGLFDLEFDVVDGSGGVRIIVRSETAILEPFLHFVLVLDWPGGRLFKEYTVSLDLPSANEFVAPVKRVQISRPSREGTRADRTLALSHAGTDLEKITTFGDTLWSIARATRPNRSISVPQMMLAIQQENPEAFLGSNINRLKAGYPLRIPNLADATLIEKREAESVVAAQNKSLSDPQSQKRASPLPEPFLDHTSPQETEVAVVQHSSGAELLVIADEAFESDLIVSSEVTTPIDALSQAEAALAASVSEQKALSDRLTALESNLVALTSTIEVKDRALARLQQELMMLRNQAPPPSSGLANPLVLGLLLVVILLLVLILVLANRLRLQARRVEGLPTHSNQQTEDSEIQRAAQSRPKNEEITATPSPQDAATAAIGESPAASDEVSVASEGTIDLGEIDPEEEPMSHPLDLARAYIEMGDEVSAKTQLAEVIATGSPDEVREAEQLLEQLRH